jgi:hypothetical protein
MPSQFTIELNVPDSRREPTLVEVTGDMNTDTWQDNLMRGVAEVVSMMEQMKGGDFVAQYIGKRQ